MKKADNPMENPTIKEVFNSMNDNQKDVLYAIVGYVAEIEKEKTKRWRDRYSKKKHPKLLNGKNYMNAQDFN